MRKPRRTEIFLALMLCAGLARAGLLDQLAQDKEGEEFLPAEQAFALSAFADGPDRIRAQWSVAPEYYLYRHRLRFRLLDADALEISAIDLPTGQAKHDEHFGAVEVYYEALAALLTLSRPAPDSELSLEVRYQGCAEAGLCYPPRTEVLPIVMPPAP